MQHACSRSQTPLIGLVPRPPWEVWGGYIIVSSPAVLSTSGKSCALSLVFDV